MFAVLCLLYNESISFNCLNSPNSFDKWYDFDRKYLLMMGATYAAKIDKIALVLKDDQKDGPVRIFGSAYW